jgi:hypothetical protein
MMPKNKTYSGDSKDCLASFKIIGNLLDLPPRKVAGVFFLKQALAVASILKNGDTTDTESRMSRFTDTRNFCVLAEGVLRDEEAEREAVSTPFKRQTR